MSFRQSENFQNDSYESVARGSLQLCFIAPCTPQLLSTLPDQGYPLLTKSPSSHWFSPLPPGQVPGALCPPCSQVPHGQPSPPPGQVPRPQWPNLSAFPRPPSSWPNPKCPLPEKICRTFYGTRLVAGEPSASALWPLFVSRSICCVYG